MNNVYNNSFPTVTKEDTNTTNGGKKIRIEFSVPEDASAIGSLRVLYDKENPVGETSPVVGVFTRKYNGMQFTPVMEDATAPVAEEKGNVTTGIFNGDINLGASQAEENTGQETPFLDLTGGSRQEASIIDRASQEYSQLNELGTDTPNGFSKEGRFLPRKTIAMLSGKVGEGAFLRGKIFEVVNAPTWTNGVQKGNLELDDGDTVISWDWTAPQYQGIMVPYFGSKEKGEKASSYFSSKFIPEISAATEGVRLA